MELYGDCENTVDLTRFKHIKVLSLHSVTIKSLPFPVDHLILACDNAECVNNSQIKALSLVYYAKGITNFGIEELSFVKKVKISEFEELMNDIKPLFLKFYQCIEEVFEILHTFDFVREIRIYNLQPFHLRINVDLFDHLDVLQFGVNNLISTSRSVKLSSKSSLIK